MATRKRKGVSLAKGPIAIIGIASLVYGIAGLILGGQSFSGVSFPSGTVNGETFIGIEGNGWTNLMFIAGGALLLFGAPLHWGAKTMGILVGLAAGAASVISLIDGEDVLGIFAANGLTKLVWGAAAGALLFLSLLPRVGGKRVDTTDGDRPRGDDRVAEEREERVAQRRFDRERDLDPGRDTVGTRREPVADDASGSRPAGDAGPGGSGRVVAPADGDGPADHGRNRA